MAIRISNPPNPWLSCHADWLGEPPEAELEVYEEEARAVIAENDSPDVGFRFSVNPYRGCFHACAYCYARTSHEYLSFGAGTDFDRKIVVKVNAPEMLRRELEKPSWKGGFLAFSGNTDCYQPLEAVYGLTRRCLEVCLERKNPVGVITKSALVRRDADLLARLAQRAEVSVFLSIPFAHDDVARAIEPNTSPPSQRFETIRILSQAGLRTGVGIAPVIPGLNDSDLAEILRRARDAGASESFMLPLRLSGQTLPVFRERIQASLPNRASKVFHAIQEMRGGKWNETRFGDRMRGSGPRWEAIRRLYEIEAARLGFGGDRRARRFSESRPPAPQGELF